MRERLRNIVKNVVEKLLVTVMKGFVKNAD